MTLSKRSLVSGILAVVLSVGGATAATAAAGGPANVLHAASAVATSHGNGHSGAHPANHGKAVSEAAHTCKHGPHGKHGHCVNKVAKGSAGK